ncbi:MAG: acetylglutamate kinase [Cyclobacteriaceae bacterium]|nr:acetylglutamate kinase [Cyclobacteriaceae bacterium]
MNKLYIIKIGGKVLDDKAALSKFLQDFSSIREPKILVHGGGTQATQLGEQLGIKTRMINGRRITDANTLSLVTMVYGGLVNKQIVAELQQKDCNAMGVTGADGNMIKAERRPVQDIDFGFVGDILPAGVNTSLMYFLLKQNVVPVFAPLTHSDGTMLNTNADTIASVLAIALSKHFDVRLIFCFEKKGVLQSENDNESTIKVLSEGDYRELLRKGIFTNGMLPKLENAFAAIHSGVKEVMIGDATHLLNNTGQQAEGTHIVK